MVEDGEGLTPVITSLIVVIGLATDVMVNSFAAQILRSDRSFWGNRDKDESNRERVCEGREQEATVFTLALESENGKQREGIGVSEGNEKLVQAANDMIRRRWEQWLKSGIYGMIVQARLDEWEGIIGSGRMVMGRSGRKCLARAMRRYVLMDGVDLKLFYREKNGELATCVLEENVPKVLRDLHEGHGHFAARITLGRADGKVYWPSRAQDIGR